MSGITATGLKKWKPTSRSGCLSLAPICSTDERRGVGREDRVVGEVLLDLGEDLLLDAELLEDGLDDPVAVGEVGLVGGSGDERLEPVRLVRADPALAEQLVDLAADVVDALVDARLVEVGDDHRHLQAAHEEQRELAMP